MKEIEIRSFVYPGCIIVCNASAKFVNGYLPEIARIYKDRSIEWMRKRITPQMREYVEWLAKEPHVSSSSAGGNFYERKRIYARDMGQYIGLYTTCSAEVLNGAIWKDDKRCMDEWEEIQGKYNIEWI